MAFQNNFLLLYEESQILFFHFPGKTNDIQDPTVYYEGKGPLPQYRVLHDPVL